MLIDTRTALPSDSYQSPLKTRVENRGAPVGEPPHNPYDDMTVITAHDGMTIVNIYARATVVADPDRHAAIKRAVRQHSLFLAGHNPSLLSQDEIILDAYGEPGASNDDNY